MNGKQARRKTPYEKKQDRYDRDRFPQVEHPKLFRGYWRRKKTGTSQNKRRGAQQLIDVGVSRCDTDELSLSLLNAQLPTRNDRKDNFLGCAPTWREALTRKLESRKAREGWTQHRKRKAAEKGQDLGAQRQERAKEAFAKQARAKQA